MHDMTSKIPEVTPVKQWYRKDCKHLKKEDVCMRIKNIYFQLLIEFLVLQIFYEYQMIENDSYE